MGKILYTVLCTLVTVTVSHCVSGLSTKAGLAGISLDDVLQGNYSAASYSGSWVSDTELEFWRGYDLYQVNVETGVETLIFEGNELLEPYGSYSVSFSPDKNFVLITYDRKNLWRHSYRAHYDIYHKTTKATEKLFPTGATETELMLFQWAPTGNGFAYVHENDIYFRASAASGSNTRRVTVDGSADIVNGHSDWVYEEEMFGSAVALWFSNDVSSLAFIQFNDADVDSFQYPMYGEPGDLATVYPSWTQIRYPKSGKTNPVAILKTVDLTVETSPLVTYRTEQDDGLNFHYIATVRWKSATEVFVVYMNRAQTTGTWLNCNVATEACVEVKVQSETAGWIDVYRPIFSADETSFLTILPKKLTTPALTYKQIVSTLVSTKAETQITNQLFSVDSILGRDEVNNKIYFSATGISSTGAASPSESQIYEVTAEANAVARCLTCNLENTDQARCKSNYASFSKQFKYFMHTCAGPGIPESQIRNTATSASVRVLENNAALRKKLETAELPIVKDYDIPLGNTGFTAKARLYLPPTFDETESTKYPLLIDVYGGPDSQKIGEGYSVHWGTSLVTDRNIIYGYIDGRGSGRQSKELMFQLYRKLGTVEIDDQIAVTKWLVENTNFINANQTGIWGWSYGGYATAMAMVRDTENVFKCGISVAPVTSWLYYDSIYTERYMGQPTAGDNLKGYENGEVTTQVENFKNKQFFLVHGNADDNVHYQQSMILSRALEQADVMFNQLSYPDEAHGISGTGMRRHLYHSLEKFLFRDCFPSAPDDKNGGSIAGINAVTIVLSLFTAFTVLLFNF